MSVPTAAPARGAPAEDLAALASVLLEHRRARTDQIEAILWLAATGAADGIDIRELDAARIALAETEAALEWLVDQTRPREVAP